MGTLKLGMETECLWKKLNEYRKLYMTRQFFFSGRKWIVDNFVFKKRQFLVITIVFGG